MADPLPWPSVLMPSSEDWSLRGGSRSGGQTFQGNEQIVMSPTARWKASMTIPCWEPEHVLAMRRVIALGRAATWLLGPYEYNRAPWNVDPLTGGKITYARGQEDAASNPGWAINPDTTSRMVFYLAAEATIGSTFLTIQRDRGGLLAEGMILSIGNRLHIITTLLSPNFVDGNGLPIPGAMNVEVRPALRATYPASSTVEIGAPVGTMRLATDDTGALSLDLSRLGNAPLEFVEAF